MDSALPAKDTELLSKIKRLASDDLEKLADFLGLSERETQNQATGYPESGAIPTPFRNADA